MDSPQSKAAFAGGSSYVKSAAQFQGTNGPEIAFHAEVASPGLEVSVPGFMGGTVGERGRGVKVKLPARVPRGAAAPWPDMRKVPRQLGSFRFG